MSTIKYLVFLTVSFIWANLYLILLFGVLLFLVAFLMVSVSLFRANPSGYLVLLKGVGLLVGLFLGGMLSLRFAVGQLRSGAHPLRKTAGAVLGLALCAGFLYVDATRFLHPGVLSAKIFYAEFIRMVQQFRA